jgi:hypothetical protein
VSQTKMIAMKNVCRMLIIFEGCANNNGTLAVQNKHRTREWWINEKETKDHDDTSNGSKADVAVLRIRAAKSYRTRKDRRVINNTIQI